LDFRIPFTISADQMRIAEEEGCSPSVHNMCSPSFKTVKEGRLREIRDSRLLDVL
jgi:hypothetical protein